MNRVENLRVKVGGSKCFMTFMVLNSNGYNLLMGLDFLMKIGDVVDVGKGLIQIKNGHGLDVQVLLANTINVVYSLTSGDEFRIIIMRMFILCEESESVNDGRIWGPKLCIFVTQLYKPMSLVAQPLLHPSLVYTSFTNLLQ